MSAADAKNNLLDVFLDDYFAECDEHLVNVQRNLLALESYVNQPQVDRKLLDELFRSFHTLKGLSGMVSLQEAEQLAHQMESYLKTLRDQKSRLSSAGLDGLIHGTKVLEEVIKAYQAHHPLSDVQTVLLQLNGAFSLQPALASSVDNEATKTDGINLADSEKPQKIQTPTTRVQRWQFEFSPSTALVERDVNVNTIRERLKAIGEILQAEPKITGTGGVIFRFIVDSEADETAFAGWERDGLVYQKLETTETVAATAEIAEIAAAGTKTVGQAIAAIEDSPCVKNDGLDELPLPPLASSPVPVSFASDVTLPTGVVRVELSKLNDLMCMVGELVITRSRLEDQLSHLTAVSAVQKRSLQEVNQTLERQLRELREGVMRVRLVPIGEIFTRMQFVVRDLARESQKQIRLELEGQETEIDKFVVERMMDPLLHLVRNAVSHALESAAERSARGKATEGKIWLRASTAGETVVIEVEDDGRGIDAAQIAQHARSLGIWTGDRLPDVATLLDILCAPGFSTREEADRVSGRGVGMAIVKNTI
ncbi:MAG TPA: Hpt domain-containing protein, partial [Allocoleopsis sp.]